MFRLKKDISAHAMETLQGYFARWGVAKTITTDGACVFTSASMTEFLERWGVVHRVLSAYYPQANKRAKVAVKSAKRIAMEKPRSRWQP